MEIDLEIITNHEISDVLWNPEYVDLFKEEWFRRVVNRLLYSPIHPKIALMPSYHQTTIIDEIQNHFEEEIRNESEYSTSLEQLIRELLKAKGRMQILNKLMQESKSFIICQRIDLDKLKERYSGCVFEKFLLKSWKDLRPTNIIVTKKVKYSDITLDVFPKSLEKIFILSDKRHGDIIESIVSPLFSDEGRFPILPLTNLNNMPDISITLQTNFSSFTKNSTFEKALGVYRKEVEKLKSEKIKLKKIREKIDKISEEDEKILDTNMMLLQATMISSSEEQPMITASKTAAVGSEVWLGTTIESKYIVVPLHTRIFVENIVSEEVEEISPSDFKIAKHRLILLDSEVYKNIIGQRAAVMNQLLEEMSLIELYELNAFQSKRGYVWSDLGKIIIDASLSTRRLIEVSSTIGDSELAEKLISHLRKNNISEYDSKRLPSRWNRIEDWIEVDEILVPIPAGPERTSKMISMKAMFDVLNSELDCTDKGQDDWAICWEAVNKLQHIRQNYLKKSIAKEQKGYSLDIWKKAIVEEESTYYKLLDEFKKIKL